MIGSDDNSYLLGTLDIKPGEQVQAVIPGAIIKGLVETFGCSGDVLILKTTDAPPVRWAINARQLIAIGRIGHA